MFAFCRTRETTFSWSCFHSDTIFQETIIILLSQFETIIILFSQFETNIILFSPKIDKCYLPAQSRDNFSVVLLHLRHYLPGDNICLLSNSRDNFFMVLLSLRHDFPGDNYYPFFLNLRQLVFFFSQFETNIILLSKK